MIYRIYRVPTQHVILVFLGNYYSIKVNIGTTVYNTKNRKQNCNITAQLLLLLQ